jgi:hypothetical protein
MYVAGFSASTGIIGHQKLYRNELQLRPLLMKQIANSKIQFSQNGENSQITELML